MVERTHRGNNILTSRFFCMKTQSSRESDVCRLSLHMFRHHITGGSAPTVPDFLPLNCAMLYITAVSFPEPGHNCSWIQIKQSNFIVLFRSVLLQKWQLVVVSVCYILTPHTPLFHINDIIVSVCAGHGAAA